MKPPINAEELPDLKQNKKTKTHHFQIHISSGQHLDIKIKQRLKEGDLALPYIIQYADIGFQE